MVGQRRSWPVGVISSIISYQTHHIQDNQSLNLTGSFQIRSRTPVLKRGSVAVDKPSRDQSVLVNFTVSVVVGLLLKGARPRETSAHVQVAVYSNV